MPPSPPHHAPDPLPDLAGLTLLVVEDDEGTLEALMRLLTGCGATILGARTVSAALAHLNTPVKIDALISDLSMPEMDGVELIQLPPSIAVEWRQGSALALPFADGAFDVALCQQGLQFFPDRVKALREMRRVLASGGRVACSVWTGPSPYFVAQREGLARHVSPDAATSIASAFTLGDSNELSSLLKAADFHRVVVHHVRMTLRFPPLEEFLLNHLSALPVADLVARAGDEVRTALVVHMKDAMRAYVDGYGLAVPQEVNVAIARV